MNEVEVLKKSEIANRYYQRADLSQVSTYEQLKDSIMKELVNVSEGYVRVGYLLRRAIDENLLYNSGYRNIEEFAWAEFKIKKDAVSRFMNINKLYSENGYSDRLQERYRGYGVAKLSEMISLPAEIAESIEPEHTREQIREIKRELAAEQEITEIELMQESVDTPEQEAVESDVLDTLCKRFLYSYFKTDEGAEIYVRIYRLMEQTDEKRIFETLAPSGINTMFARVPQVGKLMLTIKGMDKPVEVLNMRDLSQKEVIDQTEFIKVLRILMPDSDKTPEECWEMIYAEDFPSKPNPPMPVPAEPVKKEETQKSEVKTSESGIKPHTEEVSTTVEKEPENRINTLQEVEKTKEVATKEQKKEEKTEVKSAENGVKPHTETTLPPVEEKPSEPNKLDKAFEYTSYIEKCLIEGRWQQALFTIKDLNDEVISLRDKSKIIDIPGQMSITDME